MLTPKLAPRTSAPAPGAQTTASAALRLFSVAFLFFLILAGCKKDVAQEASDSDANGYVCLKCEAKLYTDRTVFIGPKCPKCQQDSLVEVVGYVCPKDNHLTIRAKRGGRGDAPVCESCQGPLGGMCLPREKDLKAWGATKDSS